MLWCKHCKKAVALPVTSVSYEIPNVEVSGYEKIKTYYCPDCGRKVYLEAGYCVMCGGYAAPGKELCDSCHVEIREALNELTKRLDLPSDNVMDGVAKYLIMEG
ncbi:hypothetical protein ACPW7J_09625 [Ihubacter sp. rT4E-8]|uniref:hypothetical protein n=1 Tax=Ihubacter sp. rT4E-8 TaxID=3242369 RepID=UPI003CE983D0